MYLGRQKLSDGEEIQVGWFIIFWCYFLFCGGTSSYHFVHPPVHYHFSLIRYDPFFFLLLPRRDQVKERDGGRRRLIELGRRTRRCFN